MRKTDKKIDNALIKVLTEVCDIAQENYAGFEWITHFANYNNFPGSLSVVCIYGTNEQLEKNLNDSGKLFLTHTRVEGKYTLRIVVGQTSVELQHVENAWMLVRELAINLINSQG